jgi:hypothetical protein
MNAPPVGRLQIDSTCRVTGQFAFSNCGSTCFTAISLAPSVSQMWLSADGSRVSGFAKGAIKITSSQTLSDLGAVPMELISKSGKTIP